MRFYQPKQNNNYEVSCVMADGNEFSVGGYTLDKAIVTGKIASSAGATSVKIGLLNYEGEREEAELEEVIRFLDRRNKLKGK
jgi:hypothetical protein